MPTASYLAQQAVIGHEVQWLVEIELDRCSLHYTTAPCAAVDQGDNSRCYYSFGTCQDPQNYSKSSKIYRFCLNRVPWPDPAVQVFPYLSKFVSLPQSIDPSKLFTYPEKVTIDMAADWSPPALDTDKTLSNSTTAGEFWRNLVARSRNYVGRPLRIYRGFYSTQTSFLLADFLRVGPEYRLTGINIGKTGVTITAESPLALLNQKQVPFTITDDNTIQNAAGITAGATSVTVLRAAEYPDPAAYSRFLIYAQIELEIVSVTARDTSTQVLTIGRGKLGTTAAIHPLGVKVEHVAFFGTANAGAPTSRNVIQVMRDLLHWAGIVDGDINTTSFDNLATDVWPEVDVQRIVRRPAKISRHLQGLRETRGVMIYLDSDGLWSAAALAPTTIGAVIDEDHELEGQTVITEDEESRLTRCGLWWNPIVQNPGEDSKDYASGAIGIDAELETANNFGEAKSKTFYDPWISDGAAVSGVRNIARRIVTRLRYGLRKVKFTLDIVDNTLDVGMQRLFKSRHILDRNGAQVERAVLVVSRRERSPSQTEYEAVDVNFGGRYLRIGADTLTDSYTSASAADRQYGYWGDTNNRVGSQKDQGYIFW